VVDYGEPITRSFRVFLSYAPESEHVKHVMQLYELLRSNGVDAYADTVTPRDQNDLGALDNSQDFRGGPRPNYHITGIQKVV
jgi:hypothetical protein